MKEAETMTDQLIKKALQPAPEPVTSKEGKAALKSYLSKPATGRTYK